MYEVIDILSENWIELIESSNCEGFLCSPPCEFQEWKTIYDERLYVLNKIMKRPIYPWSARKTLDPELLLTKLRSDLHGYHHRS